MNTAPTAPAPAPSAPAPAPVQALPPGHHRQELTPSEADAAARWVAEDLKAGKVSEAQAAKSFDQLNTPPEQRAPDTRSEEEKTLDLLAPVAKPEDFLIRYDHLNPHEPVPPEVREFDAAARTWLSESGLPRELGNSLVNIVDRVSKDTASMDEAAREQYGYQQYEILQKTFGDTLDIKLERARQMVQELEKRQPGLNALLRSGIGDDARVASMLIQHADIYFARKGQGGSHAR